MVSKPQHKKNVIILLIDCVLFIGIQASRSANDIGACKTNFDQLYANLGKKVKKIHRGISKYLDEDNDEDSDDDFDGDGKDEVFGSNEDKSMMAEKDPTKLIDLELVNLLKFCNDLKNKYKDDDDYQEEIMMKSMELGKQTKEKTLILDMDETLIAAKFEGKEPKKFVRSFSFPFGDTEIHVRLRPYLSDCLEKLSQLYEIVVFTAGVQDYADPILDVIDPEKTIFKTRMYRTSCIKADQFFIKDLDIILDRDKKDVIIVDNSILSFAFDLANGVPINSFIGDEEDDKDLLYLVSFLEEAFYQSDVRIPCEEAFRLQYLLSTINGKWTHQRIQSD